MQIGIDSFAAAIPDPQTGVRPSAAKRLQNLVEEIELADQAGVDRLCAWANIIAPEFLTRAGGDPCCSGCAHQEHSFK